MQGAQTTTEIFEKTTPALKITNNKLSEISADAWKDMAQYLNTKHTDKIQIKQDPASGVLTFDDPFQQRTVGKPSDSTVMQKPLAHDKPDSTGSHCNNKTDLPKIKDRPKWIANPSPSDNPVAINTDKLPPSNILLEQLSW